jgi:hypothetical protein
LKIRLIDGEEPRIPSQEEIDLIVKKLFDVYKQQKQQVMHDYFKILFIDSFF